MDLFNEGHAILAFLLAGLIAAGVAAGRFKSKTLGLIVGVVVFGFFAGLNWLLSPANTMIEQSAIGPVELSCVEFNTQADAASFNKTGVIPAGSKVSTKTSDCTGIRIASK